MQNARNSLYRKQWTVLLIAKNRFYECSKQIRIYSKHDVQRANFINVEIDFINAEKHIRSFWNLNMKKHLDLTFKVRKQDFTRCFIRKERTIFLNNEQKIIYAEKRVNNFLNNAEQKIILCRMLETVYAENSEQFLWENNEQFYLMQKKILWM